MQRSEALALLRQRLPGNDLRVLARNLGVQVEKNGKKNKGWVGQTIERTIDLAISTKPLPDGEDFELKSTTIFFRDGEWNPKETIKITQLNPSTILEETFETSRLWKKLSHLVIVGVMNDKSGSVFAEKILSFDVVSPESVKEIRQFWLDVQYLVTSGNIVSSFDVGTSEEWIQLRPTGTGQEWSTCPVTGRKFPARAFYATKRLLREVFRSVQT